MDGMEADRGRGSPGGVLSQRDRWKSGRNKWSKEVVCKLLEVSNPLIPLRLSKHLRFVPSIIWLLKLLEFSNLIHIS